MSDEIKQKAEAVRLQLLEHLLTATNLSGIMQEQARHTVLANINTAAEVLNKLDVVRLDAGYLADVGSTDE